MLRTQCTRAGWLCEYRTKLPLPACHTGLLLTSTPFDAQARGNITNKVLDGQLWYEADSIEGPHGIPRSLFLLYKLFDVMDPADVEQHMCPKRLCAARFPYRARGSAWHEHAEETCGHDGCTERRFRIVRAATGRAQAALKPALRWWYIGVTNVVKCAYADPDFVAMMDAAEAARVGNGLHASNHARWLREQLVTPRFGLTEEEAAAASLWGLGMDGGQLFITKQHSTWVICIMCAAFLVGCRCCEAFAVGGLLQTAETLRCGACMCGRKGGGPSSCRFNRARGGNRVGCYRGSRSMR